MKISSELFLKRKPLAEQIADALRNSIANGIWRDLLPPERSLCAMADVSRPVLRQALHRLQDEGWVGIVHGHPTRILQRPARHPPSPHPQRATMLFTEPLSSASKVQLLLIDEIRRYFYQEDLDFSLVNDQRLQWRNPRKILQGIVRRYASKHWILASQPLAVQRWFQEQRLHAVVLGMVFPGIRLPSVAEDQRAICRHAAGIFLGKGHRRIAYVRRQLNAAGDLASLQGFQEAFHSAAAKQAIPVMINHRGNPNELRKRLQTLLASPQAPTALLISHAADVLTALCALWSWGIKVPAQVSIISQASDDLFDHVTPAMAQYQISVAKQVRWIRRLLAFKSAPVGAPRQVLMLPPFHRGATVAPPRSER